MYLFIIDIVYYLALCSPTYDDINHFFQQLHITGHTFCFYTSHDWWEKWEWQDCLNLTNNLFLDVAPVSAGVITGAVVAVVAIILIILIVLLIVGFLIYRNKGEKKQSKQVCCMRVVLGDNGITSIVM